jgi:DNA polymerase (family 10)
MDNSQISDNFSLLSKLMEIHGDNSFKAKSYAVAAFTIDKLSEQVSTLPAAKIFSIKGIGESVGKKVLELLEKGELIILKEYISKTPQGILEMLQIKGIGPKKIATIWKDLEIETLGELLYACNENRLLLYKGFGEKTQKNIKENIEFFFSNVGNYLYQQVENFAEKMNFLLQNKFPENKFLLTGEFRRQLETITKIEWVTTVPKKILIDFFIEKGCTILLENENYIVFKSSENITLGFHLTSSNLFYSTLFRTSCSDEFLSYWETKFNFKEQIAYNTELEIFQLNNVSFIPSYLREKPEIIDTAIKQEIPKIIEPFNICGIIHSHSNWSDGVNTIEEMAKSALDKGLQYLVISDHSKAAFYANGLTEDRIIAQHEYIEVLNKKLYPFKIFKSIECDILNDGSLDYSEDVLANFDVIIASIHSNLKMNEEKAMLRLLTAIENPFTSILGHMTGRLLLSRNGYPINHKTIIEACAANNVVIELNAHPRRLDIDWRWIDYALKKNVLISINPDAHSIDGFEDYKYGVLVAQKAGLTPHQNLSSYNLKDFENFLVDQHQKRN